MVGYGRQLKMCATRRRRVSPTIIDAYWAHIHLSAIPDRGGQKVKNMSNHHTNWEKLIRSI
jgi:hypothetical protein